MAQLAGEGRVHYCRLHACAGASFHREFGGVKIATALADDPGNPAFYFDGDLHGLPFCPGKGARHVAEPTVAAALDCASGVAWVDHVAGYLCGYAKGAHITSRITVALDTSRFEFVSLADGLGRGVSRSSHGPRTSGNMGNGVGSLSQRFLDGNAAVAGWRACSVARYIWRREHLNRRCRRTHGFDWFNALRECLRAGRTVGAAGVNVGTKESLMSFEEMQSTMQFLLQQQAKNAVFWSAMRNE